MQEVSDTYSTMDAAQSQIHSWMNRLSEINPNIIAVLMVVTLIPLIFFVDSIGKTPPIKPATVSNRQIVTVEANGTVRTKEVEPKKNI